MKGTISDLNDYLFEALDTITNSDLEGEALERELKRAGGIIRVAETIIHNGELALQSVKQLNEYGYENIEVPALLGGGK